MQNQKNDTYDSHAESIENFNQLLLQDKLLKGISNYGLQKPTELQAKGIASILQFQDTIIHLQAGSGKSVLYAISILQMIDPFIQQLQALILAPTREVAKRDYELLLKLGESMDISIAICTNKPGSEEDLQEINAQVIIATVLGIKKMKNKGLVQLGKVRLLVLDEADEIFSRGFEADLRDLTKGLADETQVIVSTCTMPQELKRYTEEFMNEPVVISKQPPEALNVSHFRVDVEKENWKFETLVDILEYTDLQKNQCLVHCNSKTKAEKLVTELEEKSWKLAFLDADMIQHDKQSILDEFSKGLTRLLIITDALKNEFVPEVQLMINYDLPLSPEKYFRRAEKCKKNKQKTNLLINFTTSEDKQDISKFESFLNVTVEELPMDFDEKFLK